MPHFAGVPASLAVHTRWLRLAVDGQEVPAMVSHPAWSGESPPGELPIRPWLLWMHGRTVRKEIDPGRFQRLLRAGIATVSVDLPGHGERLEAWAQEPSNTLQVVDQMIGEIDGVVDAVHALGGFDLERMALGGMSAGGMVTLARLCRPHRFSAAVVECTTGSWRWQPNVLRGNPGLLERWNPIGHLDGWRPIPLLALHNRHDEWVALEGQEEFLSALRARYTDPSLVELHVYERTGAPYEHAGFGKMGADAKDRVARFVAERLVSGTRPGSANS